MSERRSPDRGPSALEAALARVGDRWSLLVVEALRDGPRRWTELVESLPGIAPNILSERLKRLEREGVVASEVYSERPVRVSYRLTGEGADLGGALRLLAAWGARSAGGPEPPRHATCGTPMDARWFCPTCSVPVAEDEGDDLDLV